MRDILGLRTNFAATATISAKRITNTGNLVPRVSLLRASLDQPRSGSSMTREAKKREPGDDVA